MRTKLFNYLATGLITSGLLAIAPSTSAQTARLQTAESKVEHLTCVKDAQGLMCKTEERDSKPVAPNTTVSASIVSSEQLGHFSNALLASLYFVLPAGLGLAIFLRDKQSELLNQQIQRLEKLWSQTPQ